MDKGGAACFQCLHINFIDYNNQHYALFLNNFPDYAQNMQS